LLAFLRATRLYPMALAKTNRRGEYDATGGGLPIGVSRYAG
jgi:hypothetical protein